MKTSNASQLLHTIMHEKVISEPKNKQNVRINTYVKLSKSVYSSSTECFDTTTEQVETKKHSQQLPSNQYWQESNQ